MKLTLTNNSVPNPQTVDLSIYPMVEDGEGMDLANPAFTNRVYTRSLLREGATLALTQYTEKELQFPLLLGPVGGYPQAPTTLPATLMLIEQINMILDTPGAVLTWQPDNASQPTYFDVIGGQYEVAYSFRKEQQDWTQGNLRVFCQPFGRTAGPRPYAAASAVGPLLMISPYASSGVLSVIANNPAESWIAGASSPRGVAVDSSHVYWANQNANTIGRANLDGSSPSQSWITGASTPHGVTVDSGHVYYSNFANNTIGRANLDGSQPSESWITGANGPYGVAVDSGHVYWANAGANPGTIGRANLDSSSPSQSWITGASAPAGIAVDANYVYWANLNANAIGRANLDGSSPSQAWIGASAPRGVAVGASYVYWTNGTGGNTIGRANLDGSSPSQSWITGASMPDAITIDSTYAYWDNNNANTIARALLAGYAGSPQGASSGIQYFGSPSLAGDAPAQLQVSFTANPAGGFYLPYCALSILPDGSYTPLITANQFQVTIPPTANAQGVAGQYVRLQGPSTTNLAAFSNLGVNAPVPLNWGGAHRVFALARASGAPGVLVGGPDLNTYATTASVLPDNNWRPYDLGVLTLKGSQSLQTGNSFIVYGSAPASSRLDVTALVTLPDYATWFLNGAQASNLPFQGAMLLDDVRGDQFNVYVLANTGLAPLPAAAVTDSLVTSYSRGLVPRPDPKNGLPIISIFEMWARTDFAPLVNAQLTALERARYVLP